MKTYSLGSVVLSMEDLMSKTDALSASERCEGGNHEEVTRTEKILKTTLKCVVS